MTDPEPGRPLLRTMRRVRSVRSFRPDPVPDALLTEILEVARWTGSGSNRQPWTFIVVREPATLGAIAAASPNVGHVAGAAAAIVIVMDGGMPEIETFDEGRVTERILVAATALGLASAIGWIMSGGAAAVGALLGVPEGRRVRTLVSLGYPTEEASRPKSAPGAARRPLAEMVRFERFS
ncbi:MAG TPA: nitroreductase family protein [Candidatus Limnocylindrales bacterium]